MPTDTPFKERPGRLPTAREIIDGKSDEFTRLALGEDLTMPNPVAEVVARLRERAEYCRQLDSGSGDAKVFDAAADEIESLRIEVHAIKYEVMGGEDVPGSANAATVDDVRNEIARLVGQNITAQAEIERLSRERDTATNWINGLEDTICEGISYISGGLDTTALFELERVLEDRSCLEQRPTFLTPVRSLEPYRSAKADISRERDTGVPEIKTALGIAHAALTALRCSPLLPQLQNRRTET